MLFSPGRVSFSNFGPYSITKYGVEAFSDALRREIAPWGVGVSLIEPGGFRTGLMSPQVLAKHARQAWSNLSEGMKTEYGQEFLEQRKFPYAPSPLVFLLLTGV